MPRSWELTPTPKAAFSMAACGGGVCERVDAAEKKFYGSNTECKYTEGGATVTVKPGTTSTASCNMSLSKCTSADNAVLDSYLKCIETAPACTAGAEKAAVDAQVACALQLVSISGAMVTSKLSADCAAGFK
jgi:hypothetical protein